MHFHVTSWLIKLLILHVKVPLEPIRQLRFLRAQVSELAIRGLICLPSVGFSQFLSLY